MAAFASFSITAAVFSSQGFTSFHIRQVLNILWIMMDADPAAIGGDIPSVHPSIRSGEFAMPSLIRFLTIIGLIFGIFYGTMYFFATYYEPEPREITKTVRNVTVK
jgi:hypothetical protein